MFTKKLQNLRITLCCWCNKCFFSYPTLEIFQRDLPLNQQCQCLGRIKTRVQHFRLMLLPQVYVCRPPVNESKWILYFVGSSHSFRFQITKNHRKHTYFTPSNVFCWIVFSKRFTEDVAHQYPFRQWVLHIRNLK